MMTDEGGQRQSYIGSHEERKEILASAVAGFVVTALLPRLSHRQRWATRLSARGMLISVLWKTFEIFAVRTWGPVLMKRLFDSAAELKAEATRELGHEPTPQEVGHYARRRWEAKHALRHGQPTDAAEGASG
jgi:hypothetical protein